LKIQAGLEKETYRYQVEYIRSIDPSKIETDINRYPGIKIKEIRWVGYSRLKFSLWAG